MSLLYWTVLLISKELFRINERRPGAHIGADGGVEELKKRWFPAPAVHGEGFYRLEPTSRGAHAHHDAEEHGDAPFL